MKLLHLLLAAVLLALLSSGCMRRTVTENGRLIYDGPARKAPGR